MATLFALLLTAGDVPGQPSGGTRSPEPARPILARYASLPLRFEPAASPAGDRAFVARGANYALAVTRDGVELAAGGAPVAPLPTRVVDGSAPAAVDGGEHDALADPRQHHGDGRDEIDVPAYERVAISNLHPGIDIAFHGHGREVEYDIVVAAGADPSRFAFRIDGSDAVALDATGALTLTTRAASGNHGLHHRLDQRRVGGDPRSLRFRLTHDRAP